MSDSFPQWLFNEAVNFWTRKETWILLAKCIIVWAIVVYGLEVIL